MSTYESWLVINTDVTVQCVLDAVKIVPQLLERDEAAKQTESGVGSQQRGRAIDVQRQRVGLALASQRHIRLICYRSYKNAWAKTE